VQISKDLHQRKLGEEPTKGQEMVRQMQKVR
jgi:nucleoporin p58/p45